MLDVLILTHTVTQGLSHDSHQDFNTRTDRLQKERAFVRHESRDGTSGHRTAHAETARRAAGRRGKGWCHACRSGRRMSGTCTRKPYSSVGMFLQCPPAWDEKNNSISCRVVICAGALPAGTATVWWVNGDKALWERVPAYAVLGEGRVGGGEG